MKNRTIVKRYTALSALSGRTLPSPTAVNKVSTLLRQRFTAPHEAIELSRKGVIRQHPLPEDWEGENQPAVVAEARGLAIDTLMELSTPVKKIPDHLRLTWADMPKSLKGDDKRETPNDAGIASIMELLGSLYVPGDSEEESAELEENEKDALEADDEPAIIEEPATDGESAESEE